MNMNISLKHIALNFMLMFLLCLGAKATVSTGEYYIVNDFFDKALTANNGSPRLYAYDSENDGDFIFEAVNSSGDYVMLRHKATGKYLTASTSNTWSVLLSDEGTGDQYYWKLEQLFSTTIVSKKNTSARLGCDFSSGDTYYWSSEVYVPVYYNKSAGALNWFSIIPSNGDGYESSRKATKTAEFTNEYGVIEQDAYCVTDNVTVPSGVDFHIISTTPFDGGSVNLSGEKAWLVFDNVRPSSVISTYLGNVKINGAQAVNGTNCRVEIYLRGAVVIPLPSAAPFVAITDDGSFSVQLGNTTDLGEYSNKARSFTLKRGYMVTVATGTNGGDYSRVYVADHADLTVTLPKALDQRVSSVHVRNWHYTSKSGYAGDSEGATKACGGSWYWNWDANRTSSTDLEYIPIQQHAYWPSLSNFSKEGSTAMMMINEPEHSEQHGSNCSCGGTVSEWTAYTLTTKHNVHGLRIGSPSATDLSYIKSYLTNCDNMKQRVDFSCTHGYWTTEWASSLNTLKGYGRPIWITEWEYGASWTTSYTPSSLNEYAEKVLDVLDRLEYNNYVERYSYYGTDTGGSNGWMRELFWEQNYTKGTANAGTVYKKVKPHLGYDASIQPVPNWWAPSVSTPEISNVYLSNGKYTISVKNENGDATKTISVLLKNGSSWETITTVTDRSMFEGSTIGINVDTDLLGTSFIIKVVVTTLYADGSVESAEYSKDMTDISESPLDDLQNLLFDEGTFVNKDVLTYAKDVKDASTTTSGTQEVDGWLMTETGDAHCGGQYAWGGTYGLGGSYSPATNSEGNSNGGALGILACWTATTQYTQDVIFPAGEYTLTIPVYNAGGTGAFTKNLIGFITDGGTEYFATATSYALGWTTETITFSFSGQTSGKLSLGYLAPNTGSGTMPKLFIDYVKISNGTETWPKEQAQPTKYTITFVDYDGSVLSTEDVEENAEVTMPSNPTREGYTFAGWSPEVVTVTGDATYTATYTINSYTITYIVDGEVYKTETYEYGASVTPVGAPEKEGFIFSGWSDIPSTMPAADVTVEGFFTAVTEYTITFVDYDNSVISTMQLKSGEEVTTPSDPTREGYTFAGWSPEIVTVTGDATYTATYTINSYTITYIVDGEVYKTETYEYGASVTPVDAPEKEGFIFSGWSDIPTSMPASDVTVEGTFTEDPAYTSISGLRLGEFAISIYTPSGTRIPVLRKGVNIVQLADGTFRKVLIK